MTYYIVWPKVETNSPIPGANIGKERVCWFEIEDESADKLETPLSNWLSRASTPSTNEESSGTGKNRWYSDKVVGETELRKYLTEKLYVTDFTVLAKELFEIKIEDVLDSDYNCTAKLRTFENFVWSSLSIAIHKAKLEGVTMTKS